MQQEETLQLILDKLENLEAGQEELRENQNGLIKNQQEIRKTQQELLKDVGIIKKTVAHNKEFMENHSHQVSKAKLAK